MTPPDARTGEPTQPDPATAMRAADAASFGVEFARGDTAGDAMALRVRGLRKSYGGREVVRGLDLTAPRGAITAVLGPNGAGKTTTIECCEGLRTPDRGAVEVLGLVRHSDGARVRPGVEAALRRSVGVMLQDGGLPKAPKARAVLRHVAALHENPWPVEDLLERLDLREVARTSVRRLSGGQAQRLALACAVVGRPALVFLDEPTAGLDPHARRMVWALVEELRAGGTSMVLTTHLMDEAQRLSDLVHVVHRGDVVAVGTPAQLTGGPGVVVTLPAGAHPEDVVRAHRAVTAAGLDATVEDSRTLVLEGAAGGAPDAAGARGPGDAGGPGRGTAPRADGPAAGVPASVAARVGAALEGAGLGGALLSLRVRTLEDAFLDLTGDTLAPAPAGGPATEAR